MSGRRVGTRVWYECSFLALLTYPWVQSDAPVALVSS